VLIKWFLILISLLKFELHAEVWENREMTKNYIYGSRSIRCAESIEIHFKNSKLGIDHVVFSLI